MKADSEFTKIALLLAVSCCAFACATTVRRVPRPNVPATLCPEGPGDTKASEDECAARREAYVVKNIGSTVRIRLFAYRPGEGVTEGLGTGVVIDETGTVLTAYHVIKDADYVLAMTRRAEIGDDGQLRIFDLPPIPMSVAKVAPDRDVALLVPRHDARPTATPVRPWRAHVARIGERLWHFGQTTIAAGGKVAVPAIAAVGLTGLVAAKMKSKEGDSGGPVFAPDGTLVGVVLANNEESGVTYFVPIDDALKALGVD